MRRSSTARRRASALQQRLAAAAQDDVTPGQACSYKIGHTVWTKARERAKAALGARFDIKDFHSAGLDCGRVPLEVLDGVIDRYIAQSKAS
ncbi:MAG: DUF885 family protein [Alphaproteobacteria bacterium]|nr:DUF885 family protein [Alphaproteobacteria bacterium]MBV9694831.1 DUF885 family protein [Alphaproteobacteria bacterium]